MLTRSLRRLVPLRELLASAAAAAATALIAYAAMSKLGIAGLLVPLVLVLAGMLLLRPALTVSLVVGLTILCEGPTFGIFTFTQHIYDQAYKDVSVLDLLVAMAVLSVAVEHLRHRRALRVPRPLAIPLVTLLLAMIAGVVTGHAGGAGLRFAITSEHILAYLVLLPVAVANLDLDSSQIRKLLAGAMALAIVKAVLGLIEVAGHLGAQIQGSSTLTYYEPTANWLIMIALLTCCAALLARAKPPVWILLGSPLLLACLVLSYRRSFWIGAVLGLLLILLLGTSPVGRRLLVPAGLAIALAIWLLGSLNFQSQLPIVKRVATLSPSKLEANAQDRYRLDERANVLSEISQHPITGLGITIPWAATARTLAIEGEAEGRQYVHFAALWFWLKLGILGLCAYIGVLLASMVLAWQAWRRSHEPLQRAFGLASLCGLAGLVVMDTTASFTGVDARFTVLVGAQIGILALLAGRSREPSEASLPPA
jgi:O-antigen ligase